MSSGGEIISQENLVIHHMCLRSVFVVKYYTQGCSMKTTQEIIVVIGF